MNPDPSKTNTPRYNAVNELSRKMRAGSVFRRDELAKRSNAVDRHLKQLQETGRVQKLSQGLYYVPRESAYGLLPPDDDKLVGAFLRDDDFLLLSPSSYNALEVGTTQLYNKTLVYNHKRHGVFQLGNRSFDFRVKPRFPRSLTPEFLFVDMLNNLDELAEDQSVILRHAKERAKHFDRRKLKQAASKYAKVSTEKLITSWLNG